MFNNRRSNGFSLIELVIVAAIVGVLVGLLLPAINHAREAANLADCANNLRQIGTAALNYEMAHRALPPFGEMGMMGSEFASFSMFWYLRAFLENEHNGADAPTGQPIRTYLCPSRRTTQAGAKCDYGLGAGPFFHSQSGTVDAGLMCLTSLRKVPDGAANTLFLAHKGLDPEFYYKPCGVPAWAQFHPLYTSYFTHAELVELIDPYLRGHDIGWISTLCADDPAMDVARHPMAFLRDRNGGYYVSEALAFSFAMTGRVPSFMLMTSPHCTMPCLFADGSVRRLTFTRQYEFDYDFFTGHVHDPSPEVILLNELWCVNDGNKNVARMLPAHEQ